MDEQGDDYRNKMFRENILCGACCHVIFIFHIYTMIDNQQKSNGFTRSGLTKKLRLLNCT